MSVDDNDAELDKWLDDLGRDGIEVALDGDEGLPNERRETSSREARVEASEPIA